MVRIISDHKLAVEVFDKAFHGELDDEELLEIIVSSRPYIYLSHIVDKLSIGNGPDMRRFRDCDGLVKAMMTLPKQFPELIAEIRKRYETTTETL